MIRRRSCWSTREHRLALLLWTKRSSRAGCCFYRGADHIVVFEGGRIVQRGTYEELLDAEGLFRTLALRQLA